MSVVSLERVRGEVARLASAGLRFVVVSGLSPVESDPWQAWLEARFPQATWVRPLDRDWPDLDRWAARIDEALEAGIAGVPCLLLAHGFGALAAVRHAATARRLPAAALLVTPAQPRRFGAPAEGLVYPMPYDATLLAPLGGAHEGSPWLQDDEAVEWSRTWGCTLVDAGRGPVRHPNAVPGATPPWAEAETVLGAQVAALQGRHGVAA